MMDSFRAWFDKRMSQGKAPQSALIRVCRGGRGPWKTKVWEIDGWTKSCSKTIVQNLGKQTCIMHDRIAPVLFLDYGFC